LIGCGVLNHQLGLAVDGEHDRVPGLLQLKSNIGNTVIETESLMKQAAALWSPDELDELKDYKERSQ
jgi:hypothetical protein